jgi:signal transduction histidine kinase
MMERVADIVWSIKPDNDALPELVARMRSFAAQTLESMGVELTFQVKGDLQKLQIPMEVRQQLYLLFKEIVNNAAKHAQATEMTISLVTDGRTFDIKMEDNGIGFDSTQVRSGGNGVKNIRQRAAQIDAVCELRTAPGLGTTWMIKLKNMVSA